MFSWLKRKSTQASPLKASESPKLCDDEEIPRYPPFMKGLPIVAPQRLLQTQSELVERVANTAIVTQQNFARFYWPAIERFASFAHLLPASQTHHHRGAGGLLRHSIEVGLWALQSADKLLLETARTPSQRREMEPRWQLAVFLAALCHDAGKPVTDLVVTNRDRTTVWQPIMDNLFTWAIREKVDSYFLDWREGRSQQHTALANLIADRIIGPEALEWILQGGTELIVWLMESLNCNPGPANLIYDLVIKADQTSVERDLRTLGVAMAGYELGVPVERHLTDVMRRFVKEGIWLINQPGARLWNIGGSLYLVWPSAGEEIARQIREDGIPGIPRTPDGILDMLVERRIASIREGETSASRLWKIAPVILAERIADIKLPAIRLLNEASISSVPIPSVEGRVIEEEVGSQRQESPPGADEPQAGCSLPDNLEKYEPVILAKAQSERDAVPKLPVLTLDGAMGKALQELVHDLETGTKRWGQDAELDSGRQILIRWPDALSGYGLSSKEVLDEMTQREWLWIDPMAPLKKVLDSEIGGKQVKAIRLTLAVSQALVDGVASMAGNEGRGTSGSRPLGGHSGELATVLPLGAGGLDDIDITPVRDKSASSKRSAGTPGTGRSGVVDGSSSRETSAANGTTSSTEGVLQTVPHASETKNKNQPAINEILMALDGNDGSEPMDGWRVIQKSEALIALRQRGLRVTHGLLAKLAEQHPDRFTIEGGVVKFRL